MDQRIHLVDQILHLSLVVATVGTLALGAHGVGVVDALAQVVLQAVMEIGLRHLARRALRLPGAIVALRTINQAYYCRRAPFSRKEGLGDGSGPGRWARTGVLDRPGHAFTW